MNNIIPVFPFTDTRSIELDDIENNQQNFDMLIEEEQQEQKQSNF